MKIQKYLQWWQLTLYGRLHLNSMFWKTKTQGPRFNSLAWICFVCTAGTPYLCSAGYCESRTRLKRQSLLCEKPDHVILIKEWFEFFLISISLCLLSYVFLPTTDTSAEERGCVCVCMCVGLLGRSLAAANIQLSFCWLSSLRHFVGLIILDTGWGQLLTIYNLEI